MRRGKKGGKKKEEKNRREAWEGTKVGEGRMGASRRGRRAKRAG
jgi:hypothetical protein